MELNPILDFLIASGVEVPNETLVLKNQLQDSGIVRPYVIVMAGRCGSTWLATAIQNLKSYGNPLEYFSEEGLRYYWNYENPQTIKDVIVGISKKYATNGVFGFKINPQRLEWLNQSVDLAATFSPDYASWIYMRRWNFVKQAFSFVAAEKSGKWHSFGEDDAPNTSEADVAFADHDIWNHIFSILKQERSIEDFFRKNSIAPLRIFYEEIYDSGDQVVLRAISHIDNTFKWNNEMLTGSTKKLSGIHDQQYESGFVARYASLINDIYSARDTIDLNVVARLVSRQ